MIMISVKMPLSFKLSTPPPPKKKILSSYSQLFLSIPLNSGGYFNPVITASVTLCGGVTVRVAVCYFFAQILGGLTGAALSLVSTVYCPPSLRIYIKTISNWPKLNKNNHVRSTFVF